MMEEEWINLHIEGMDDYLPKGIPKGSVVLIAGTPGTMKSSLAFNILYQNAMENELKGLYISLEQSEQSLRFMLEQMGMCTDDVANHVVIYDRERMNKELSILPDDKFVQGFMDILFDAQSIYGCDLLVLDSMNVYEMVAHYKSPRQDIFNFFDHLRKFGVTSFIISEMSMDSNAYCFNNEDFLADGVIYLRMQNINPIDVQRQIRIVKLRGVAHETGISRLVFDNGVFHTYREIEG